ncbi:hypothetical protein BGX33_002013 [Mortierella sp. NVP41]|nr:hypothetical protein BGX33_002013 [Mortierella sp. NVP41]
MASTGTNSSSDKSSGFMSGYMSDLSQSQDLNSFLQKNQPTYDPNSTSTSTTTATSKAPEDTHTNTATNTSFPSSSSSTSTSTSETTEPGRNPFDAKTPVGSHPLPNAHTIYQKKAIQNAALDNCADLNMELTDCLMGKAGTWWDRASMCMKAKERFALCCRLNKEVLQERGYAKEGNTAEQNLAILDYADEVTQKAMKEDADKAK